MEKRVAVIFDLDGTLSNCDHRRHLAENRSWKEFYDELSNDLPNEHVADLMRSLYSEGYYILLCSGRPDRYLHATLVWLQEHHLDFHHELYMRKDGDARDDSIVKLELLGEIRKRYEVRFAVDDRDRVVKMWRENGVPCFQCAEGDF